MKTISHKTCLHHSSIFIVVIGIFFLCCSTTIHADAQTTDFDLKVTQITFGEKHHLFGYIGQSKTIPWNANGRYIVGMRTDFHDRLAGQEDEAEIIVIDTKNGYDISVIDKTRGWNHQQGTMLYWNPYHPETQFFLTIVILNQERYSLFSTILTRTIGSKSTVLATRLLETAE